MRILINDKAVDALTPKVAKSLMNGDYKWMETDIMPTYET